MTILTTDAARKRMQDLATRYCAIEDQITEARDDQKAIIDMAKAELGVPPKALKQLAKEMGWDQSQREAQRQLEEAVDACRVALGLFADTPLGRAAQMAQEVRNFMADGTTVEVRYADGRKTTASAG